jgi:hypothetical protein
VESWRKVPRSNGGVGRLIFRKCPLKPVGATFVAKVKFGSVEFVSVLPVSMDRSLLFDLPRFDRVRRRDCMSCQ